MTEIAIQGPRGSRERLLIALVQHFAARDMDLAVVIDDPTENIDRAEKDTGRHQAAGAILTLGSSPNHSSLIGKRAENEAIDAFLQHMGHAEVTFISERTPSPRPNPLVIEISDTEGSVVLHGARGPVGTVLLSNIESVADLVSHHLNGPTS